MTEDDLDRWVRFSVYQAFIETGSPPSVDGLAGRKSLRPDKVEASLDRLAEAHSLVLLPDSHDVWMAHPFSAVPTPFEVKVGSCRYWANCAWDALGIPAMLGQDSRCTTPCPDCGGDLCLSVRDGSPGSHGSVVHFLVPARSFWADIGFT